MKIFIVILAVLVIGNENTRGAGADILSALQSTRFSPYAIIHQIFELLRNHIRKGSTEHDIPVLDPYEFALINLHTDNGIISADMNITNGVLTGLGGFHLQQINFSKSEIAIELDIEWPLITLQSEYYELEGVIQVLPILGHGAIYFEVHNFVFHGKFYLRQSLDGKSILLDKIKRTHFSIDRIISRTGVDNKLDGIFNMMVEDLLAGYLTRFSKFLTATYSDTVILLMNPILDKFDSWQIITPIL